MLDANGNRHSLQRYTDAGKPVVVIFHLGFGCLHCAEQLLVFAPMVKDFKSAGIEMVVVSTDNQEHLKQSIDHYEAGKHPIPLIANAEWDVFQAYRAYDEPIRRRVDLLRTVTFASASPPTTDILPLKNENHGRPWRSRRIGEETHICHTWP